MGKASVISVFGLLMQQQFIQQPAVIRCDANRRQKSKFFEKFCFYPGASTFFLQYHVN